MRFVEVPSGVWERPPFNCYNSCGDSVFDGAQGMLLPEKVEGFCLPKWLIAGNPLKTIDTIGSDREFELTSLAHLLGQCWKR